MSTIKMKLDNLMFVQYDLKSLCLDFLIHNYCNYVDHISPKVVIKIIKQLVVLHIVTKQKFEGYTYTTN